MVLPALGFWPHTEAPEPTGRGLEFTSRGIHVQVGLILIATRGTRRWISILIYINKHHIIEFLKISLHMFDASWILSLWMRYIVSQNSWKNDQFLSHSLVLYLGNVEGIATWIFDVNMYTYIWHLISIVCSFLLFISSSYLLVYASKQMCLHTETAIYKYIQRSYRANSNIAHLQVQVCLVPLLKQSRKA